MVDFFVDAGDAMSWLFAICEDAEGNLGEETVGRHGGRFRVLRDGERFHAGDMQSTSERVRRLWDGAWQLVDADPVAAVLQLVDHSVRVLCVLAAHDLDTKPLGVHLHGDEPAATYEPAGNQARQLLETALRECHQRHVSADSPRYDLLSVLHRTTCRLVDSERMATLQDRVRAGVFKNRPHGAVELVIEQLRASTTPPYKDALRCSFYLSGTPFKLTGEASSFLLPPFYDERQFRVIQGPLRACACGDAAKRALGAKNGCFDPLTLSDKLYDMGRKLRKLAYTGIRTPEHAGFVVSAMRAVLRPQHVFTRARCDSSDAARKEMQEAIDSLDVVVERYHAAQSALRAPTVNGKRKHTD